jgi:outer membrane protein assembly factor BamB
MDVSVRSSSSARWTALPLAVLAALTLLVTPALAQDSTEWAQWRGPDGDGTSPATGLLSSWSTEGENILWRNDFVGRSTPVAFNGKVCVNGRTGEDDTRQGVVACFDVATGQEAWRHEYPVYNTTVPFTRVGWANLAGDPATGLLFAQTVHGPFFAFDVDSGEIVWSRHLGEEMGFYSGYGGRTQTPLVDGDKLIVTFANTSWGAENAPRHRVRAFDTKTGRMVWSSQPGGAPGDLNAQSTPEVLIANDRRLYVHGNGDGAILAQDANTGELVWSFALSKRAINSTVLVDGTTVYAMHSEENVDTPDQGRVVAIDGTGRGDVTKTHEKWRSGLQAGYTSPAFHDGVLYVIDNSGDLYALDGDTGKTLWEYPLGTVGKASPAIADGKLFATETNGNVHILKLADDKTQKPTSLSHQVIKMPEGRPAEIYGSPAIAYGRLFIVTEEGLYALGDPEAVPAVKTPAAPAMAKVSEAPEGASPASLVLSPAETLVQPGDTIELEVKGYDAQGRLIPWSRMPKPMPIPRWKGDGLPGKLAASPAGGTARFEVAADARPAVGLITVDLGEGESAKAVARVRVAVEPPISEDFEGVAVDAAPADWINAAGKWKAEHETGDSGNKVLVKVPRERGLDRQVTYIGHPDSTGYVVQSDVMSSKQGRRMGDIGVVNLGYALDLRGSLQRLEVRSWEAARRVTREAPFAWEPDTWYTVKLDVDPTGAGTKVRAKVWPRDEDEPAEWTLSFDDPLDIDNGSPGLQGYSPTPIYYDNVKVMPR